MKVLLTGANGQLGKSIIQKKPKGIELISLPRKLFDITKPKDCKEKIIKIKPNWIINTAAYTYVDKAEEEENLALKINKDGPKYLAELVNQFGGNLLHISSDFVFNGESKTPYLPFDEISPISIYGLSKSLGEEEVIKILGDKKKAIILRTSWVMGPYGRNFANTMLNLHDKGEPFKVVSDQIGCPTSSISLASTCWEIIKKAKFSEKSLPIIMHWRDEGVTNWYEIALEIGKIGKRLNLIKNLSKIIPISTDQYPKLANRPKFSVLDIEDSKKILEIKSKNWKSSLFNAFNDFS